MSKKKIAVLFGGRSAEHDISVLTAVQAMSALNRAKYDVYPVYIKNGGFYTGDLCSIGAFTPFESRKHAEIFLERGAFYQRKRGKPTLDLVPDAALMCTHGGEGENGVLQGVLEFNRIPYTSADVKNSAVGMDKLLQKQLFSEMLLNVVRYIRVERDDFAADKNKTAAHIEMFLDYPVIVKPAGQGSSIGIRPAADRNELFDCLEAAACFDKNVIVERALVKFTEVNCAAFAHGGEIIVSETEQPLNWRGFLSFDDKYIGSKNGSDKKHAMPAPIGGLNDAVKNAVKRIYAEMGLSGVVRIDFLVDTVENKLYVNEINTIPGSLAFYLFEPLGITFSELLDKIIENALAVAEDNKRNIVEYPSRVLENFAAGTGTKHQKR
ncbi:MAG: hypothetical protein LBT55_03095 [Clostridiaceae bacterium]|jgi:D-alanine-D-alanine ligase|nr:hypothetical protein [Clostridiaceae bacterium]